jgi:hypothetical protein
VYAPAFELDSFDVLPLARRVDVMVAMLEALALANRFYLRAFPETPLLYDSAASSGIRYQLEAPGKDTWRDLPRAVSVRADDCVGLSAWRVAELRERLGEPGAAFVVTPYERPVACSTNPAAPCRIDYHVRVRRQDGRIEDPSVALGMKV